MRNIILDCDTGEDDALAILYALAKSIPLKYIVTSYGNTSIDNSTKNSSDILFLARNNKVKVIKGSSNPLFKHPIEHEVTAGDFVGKNGICNTKLSKCKYNNIIITGDENLSKCLLNVIKKESPIDYIITGPCTNFAKLFNYAGPSLKKYVKNLYIMGGALYSAGNSGPIDPKTKKQLAEFNFYCDPEAVGIVLKSNIPIKLVTWDITHKATLSYNTISSLRSHTKVGKFVLRLMKNFFKYYGLNHNRNFEFNDPLTIAAYLGVGKYINKKISINKIKKGYGKVSLSKTGSNIDYFTLKKSGINLIIEDILESLTLI